MHHGAVVNGSVVYDDDVDSIDLTDRSGVAELAQAYRAKSPTPEERWEQRNLDKGTMLSPLSLWCCLIACFGLFLSLPALLSPCSDAIHYGAVHDCTATERWLLLEWAVCSVGLHCTIFFIGLAPALGFPLETSTQLLILTPFALTNFATTLVVALVPWGRGSAMEPRFFLVWPIFGLVSFAYVAFHQPGSPLPRCLKGGCCAPTQRRPKAMV